MDHPVFYDSVTIGERGQIVIPAKARKDFGLKAGDKLLAVRGMGKMGIILLPAEDVAHLFEKFTQHVGKVAKMLGKKKKIFSLSLALLLLQPVFALTLPESISQGLKNNPAVQTSQKKVEAAQAKLNQAVGAFFPTVKLDANYGLSYSQPSTMQITTQTTMGAITQTMAFGTDANQTAKGYTASLTQPLFVAALFPGYSLAKRGAELADADHRKVIIDTSYNVTQTYFNVLQAGKMVDLSKESLNMAKSHRQQVSTMLSAGVATKADLLRADVQVANFEVALTKAQNGFELAKDAFNNALGADLMTPVSLAEQQLTGTVANLPDYQELAKLAFTNRPDWQQFLLATGISEDSLKIAQAEYLPSVMLTGSTGRQIMEYPAFSSDVNSWRVTGAASWTLFDGLGRENRIKEASANLAAQQTSAEQVRNGIKLEVRDAYLNLKSTIDTIASTTKAVDSATENIKVSTQRYDSGAGTNLEVIDAQVALTQAKTNNLQALFAVELAKAKINKVVGKEVL